MAWDEFVIHQWPAPELRQPYVLGGRHQHPALVSEERRDCCRRGLQDLPSGARLSDGDETAPGRKGVVETGPWQQDAWTRAHLSHLLVTSSTRLRFPEPRPPLWLSPARSGVRLGAGQLRGARETWMAEPSEPRSRREPPTAHMNSPKTASVYLVLETRREAETTVCPFSGLTKEICWSGWHLGLQEYRLLAVVFVW